MGGLLEIYKIFEEQFGKEKALKLTEAFETLVKEKGKELKNELKEELLKELTTKQDLKVAEQSLRALMEQIRGELQTQIEQVKGELDAKIERCRGELKAEIRSVKSDLLKWLIILFVGQATFIIGLTFTLIRLLKG